MKHKQVALVSLLVLMAPFSTAQDNYTSANRESRSEKSLLGALVPKPLTKEQVLGKILKGVLENYHITKKELNDNISKNGLKLYIERVDYGKQFFTRSDINKLNKYKYDMDDEVEKGNLKLITIVDSIMKQRLPMLETHVQQLVKKTFDFTKNEDLETDAKKRKFVGSEKELKDRWRKLIKFEFLVQYLHNRNLHFRPMLCFL